MLTFASQWILSRENVPSQSSVPSTDLAADDLPHTEAKSQVMKQFNARAAETWKTQIPCTSSRQFCRHLSNELLGANFCTIIIRDADNPNLEFAIRIQRGVPA